MKKILSVILFCIICITSFAQTKKQTNVSDSTCFCCNGYYNLPAPQISGPVQVNCADKPRYSISACPGATVNWSVSPSVPFTGNGTNAITLTPPLSASAYTITVTIGCGRGKVSSNLVIKVTTIQGCTPDFNLTLKQTSSGSVMIDAVPASTSGVEHWWGIVYNGTYPNCTIPCVSIPFSIINTRNVFGGVHETAAIPTVFSQHGMGTQVTAGSSGYGISYSFPNNSCFKVTHYINCCGVWYRQTACVSIGTTSAKGGQNETITPEIIKGEVEKVDPKELPRELRTSIDKSTNLKEE